MGVPKFFRYISERYPCLSEVIKEYQIPEFDNLYLDMNGIIHNCSHPNDNDPHFRITEKQIFQDIFHYIEILFRMIQPKQLFFMAIDGVAPRAKMNQQRGRRFRSAKEAEECEKKARDKGEELPTEKRFDSNCITPGTPFMCRLHQQLRYFVNLKMTTDKLWKNVKVILSGHETPGEGEHKIMDYIRFMKSKPDYNPNLRHCLYGLDADLIMLGLCTHDPYFSLLREEVKFNQKSNKGGKVIVTPEETKFFLLHLSLMRDYLELEFSQLKEPGVLPFPFDIEKIIDDWILMGFLIGNDFIPNLPDLHIIDGAMPLMYKVYREVLPTMQGYINEQGYLNLPRFEKFMTKLASFDFEQFREKYADIQYLEGKTNKKFSSVFHKDKKDKAMDPDLAALIKATDDELDMDDFTDEVLNYADYEEYYYSDEDEEWRKNFFTEFGQLKTDYYHYKLNYAKVTNEVLQDQAECYIRAIQWNLHYYYNGCISWSWYYPHHYAPYISDIKNFSHLNLKYEMGEPFLPFQQLLAVLPGASKDLLPKPYQDLMTLENSPIVEYYPEEFETDLNGKKVDWEAVVLIPFIDEAKLLKAMDDVEHLLTVEERSRNRHGPMLVYSYTNEHLGVALAPEYFPPIQENHAVERTMYKDEIYVHPSQLKKGLCKNVNMNLYRTHFPTLKHLKFTHKIEMAKVVVFQQPSRNESFIVQLQKTLSPSLKQVADQILGKTILINYPHLVEIRVQAVSSKDCRISYDHVNGPVIEKTTKDISDRFQLSKKSIAEDYFKKQGVEIGSTDILVFGQPVESRKYVFGPRGKVTQHRTYIKTTNTYAYQTTVFNLPQTQEFLEFKTIDEIFYPGCQCFTLCNPYYGSEGYVISTVKDENSLIKLSLRVLHEPNLYDLVNMQDTTEYNYMPGYTVASKLSISPLLLSRFTGSIFIIDSLEDNMRRKNIGLNIKFNKKNEEVVGFTRRDECTKKWFYTDNVVTLIKDFMSRFPEVFNFLKDNSSNDIYIRDEVFPNQGEARVNEIVNWLKEQPHSKAEVRRCGAQVVDEHVVSLIEQAVDSFEKTEKRMTLLVKPNKLYIPKPTLDKLCADPDTKFELFDRVVNIRDCYTVPLGYRGTVIGIIHGETSYDTMYDVVFDKPFPHGVKIRCSESRGYRMPAQALINLTHGERLHGNSNPYTKNISSTRTRNDRNTNYAQAKRQSNEQKPFTTEYKPFTASNTHSFSPDRTTFSFPRENSPVKLSQQVIKSASNSVFRFPKQSSTINSSLQVEAQYPTRVSRSNSQQSSISQSPSNSNTISHQSSPCNTLSYDKAECVENNNPIANVLQNVQPVEATTNQKKEDRLNQNEQKPIINKERCIFSNATPLIPTTQNSELFTGGLSFFGPKNILDIPENKNKLFTGEITQSKVNTDEEAIFKEMSAQIKNVYIDGSIEHKPKQRTFSRTLSEKSDSGFNISLTDLVKQNNITAATDFPTTGGLLSEIKSGHEENEDIKDTSFTTKLTQMFNRSSAHSNEEEKVKQATPSVIQTSPQVKEYEDVVIKEKSSLKCKTEMTPTIKTEMRKVTPTPGVEEEEVMIIEMSEDEKPEPSIPSHKSFQEFLSQLKSNHLTLEDTVDMKTIPTLGDLEGKPFVEEEDISTLEELETISITREPEICSDINTFTANTINEFFAQASRRQDLEQKEKVLVSDIKLEPVASTEPMVHQLFAQVSRRQGLEKVPVPDISEPGSTEPMVHELFAQASRRQGLEKVPVPDISEPVGSTEPLIHELFAQASRRHDLEQKEKVPVSDIKPEPIEEPVNNEPSDASDVLKKMLNIKSLASAAMSLPTVETFNPSNASNIKSPRVSVLPMPSSSRLETTKPTMPSSFPMQTNTSSRNIFSNPPESNASQPQTSYSLFETAQSDTINKPVSAFAAVPSQETRRSTNVLSNFQTRSHHLNPSVQSFIPPQVQKQHVDKMKPLSKWQSKYEAAIYQPPPPPPRGIPILGSQSAVYQQPQASPYQQQQHQYYHNQQGQPIYYQQQTPYPQNNLARAQNAYANQPQMVLTQSNQTHIPTQQFFPSSQVQLITQQQTPNVWSPGQHYETSPAQSSSSQFMPYQGYQGQGYLRSTQPRQTAHVQPVNHVKQEAPSLAQNIQTPQPSAMVETPAFEEQDSYLFKLLNLTRIHQLGTPEYNFTVDGSNNHMASVRIAHPYSDIVVRGKPCSRKSDAAEVCARRAFNELTQIYPPTKQKRTFNVGSSQPHTERTEQTFASASGKRYTGGLPKASAEQGVKSEEASSSTNASEEKKKQPRIAAKFNVPLKPKT